MSRFVDTQKSRMRTLVVLAIIGVTAYLALRDIIPSFVLGLGLTFMFVGPYMYFVYLYLSERRGYQDRYQQQGAEYQMQSSGMQIIALVIAAVFVYGIVAALFREFDNNTNPLYPTITTLILTIVAVQLTDYYAGKDVEDMVEHKRKSHQAFVDSIGKAEGMCMSCRKKIDAGVKVCPECGFEQKDIGTDSSYISQ